MSKMTGGKAVVESLIAQGVDTVFGIISIHTLYIYDALREAVAAGRIRFVGARHEHALGWHRDLTWWGTGEEVRGESPEDYSEEVEKTRWKEIREISAKVMPSGMWNNPYGASIFLALTDDECHELIPGSHDRWRTPFEHDVLLSLIHI